HSGVLLRVADEIDPKFEVAAATAELSARGDQAALFANLTDCQAAVVTNLFARPDSILKALGAKSLDEVAQRARDFVLQADNRGWLRRMVSENEAAERWQPRLVKSGLCQQVV